MKIYYLKPLSGYATPLRSDTLWGLLCWGIRHLWGEAKLTRFLDDCRAQKPPFVISSAFPCKRYDAGWIPFFPNPLPPPDKQVELREEAIRNEQIRKEYKKAFKFVNLDDFNKILQGTLTADDLCKRLSDIIDEEEQLREESLRKRTKKEDRVISQAEKEQTAPFLEDFSMTHNTINRLRGGTLDLPDNQGNPTGQLFHTGERYWSDKYADPDTPNTGIFFLADGPDLSKIEPVLRLFRHWGFGADRTTGKGFFDYEVEDGFAFDEPTDANAMLNLSLFRPLSNELIALDSHQGDESAFRYRIELREGYVGYHRVYMPKQAYRYFTEGSLFPLPDELKKKQPLGGLIKQFEKPHPVYDNGFGFMVHLKWNAP